MIDQKAAIDIDDLLKINDKLVEISLEPGWGPGELAIIIDSAIKVRNQIHYEQDRQVDWRTLN